MIHFELDFEKCLRSQGVDCRNCVLNCVMKILGIKANRVTLAKPEECAFCLNCQGACLVDVSPNFVIKIWDDENPQLSPVPVILKKITEEWRE